MSKDEILVVKLNMFVSDEDVHALRKMLIDQKEEGVILLPVYCEAIIAPKDVEIKVEGGATL